jgi:hypothetical protein
MPWKFYISAVLGHLPFGPVGQDGDHPVGGSFEL